MTLLLGALGCSATELRQAPLQKRDAAATSSPRSRQLDDADVKLVLLHFPALGVKTSVTAHFREQSRILEAERTLGSGHVPYWKVKFGGESARALDDAVQGLIHLGPQATHCTKRRGRDGIVWVIIVYPSREEFSLDFGYAGEHEDCKQFEKYAEQLMQLALLRCSPRGCMTPEELDAGRFECLPGPRGDECREASRVDEGTAR